ncbi:hypothetical protein PMAYCL1PPCAC_10354, partial [Pristionchus mayeri]
KTYAGIKKVLGEDFAQYYQLMAKIEDQSVVSYINEFKSTFLTTLVGCSNVKHDAEKWAPILVKGIGKIFDGYNNLSKASKINMERATCVNTTLRIMDEFIG